MAYEDKVTHTVHAEGDGVKILLWTDDHHREGDPQRYHAEMDGPWYDDSNPEGYGADPATALSNMARNALRMIAALAEGLRAIHTPTTETEDDK